MTQELLKQNSNNLNSSQTEIQIAIKSIRRDGDTQSRVDLDRTAVKEYASLMREGNKFPPVFLFFDGTDYWLADGFHRVEAALSIELEEIAAFISEGTKRDAVLHSVGVNSTHGLRRTSSDKQRAVMTLLNDEEWSKWSDREIARRCGVHHQMVGKLRSSLDESSSERIYTTKHGTVAKMKAARTNKEVRAEEDKFSILDDTEPKTTESLHRYNPLETLITPSQKSKINISELCAVLNSNVDCLSLSQAQLIVKALTRRWVLEELFLN
jgi:ParB-like nuclease domain